MLEFEPGEHTIYSVASGKPWGEGDYISELMYEVNVLSADSFPHRIPARKPILSDQIHLRLAKMEEKKEITPEKARISQKDDKRKGKVAVIP